MDRPTAVGPHVFIRGFFTLTKAFWACLTAVWIVKAGNALVKQLEMRQRSREEEEAYIDATL